MSGQPDNAPAAGPDPGVFLSTAAAPAAEKTELGFFVDVRARLEARGVYDASRLKSQRPELYAVIARLLASGICGKEEIRTLCGVAWETVAAVEADAAPTIRDFKARLSARLRLAISAAADRLLEQARAGELSAIDFGILVDKLLLIEGEATARVEIMEDPAAAAFRQAMAAIAGQAASSAPGMGLAGGNLGKGAAALSAPGSRPGAPVLEVQAVAVPVQPSDSQGQAQP